MGKKEGDFEGEYDFLNSDDDDENDEEIYDREGDEEELDEDDLDDDFGDIEEDLEKEKKRKEFLAKRQRELSDNIEAFIANGGYKQTYPNIHYSDIIDGAYITFLFQDENKFEMLSEDELELWTKGKFKLEEKLDKVLRTWYPAGTYAVFKKLTHLRKRYNLEDEEKKWRNLEELIELNEDNLIKAKKIELATAYNESGKRLNDLYVAIYGRTDKKRIRMGGFRVSVPIQFYEEEMKKSSYEKSNSFFKDFKNAKEFIFALKGNYVVGTLTDDAYEFIGGYAQGEGFLEAREHQFEINSIIVREEWFDKKKCYSLVRDIHITNEDFMYWLNKYHPEIDAALTNEDTVVFWKGKELDGEYHPEAADDFHLAIQGPIEKQEEMIKSLLNYITE